MTDQVAFSFGGFAFNRRTGRFEQRVTITNTSAATIGGPISLVLDELSSGVSLGNLSGQTRSGSPYLDLALAMLEPGQSVTVVFEFVNPERVGISYLLRLLAGEGDR